MQTWYFVDIAFSRPGRLLAERGRKRRAEYRGAAPAIRRQVR